MTHLLTSTVWLFGQGRYCKTDEAFVKLDTFKVAGVQYGDCAKMRFTPDEELVMKPESENSYDRYAVAIYHGDKKVGYIPRTKSRLISSLLKSSHQYKLRIRYFDASKEPWERLWVSVYEIG